MSKNAVIEKDENISKNSNLTEKEFLLLTQKGPPGSVLDAKNLWDSFFRLNFWKSTPGPEDIIDRPLIIESKFVRVDRDGKYYKVVDLTRGE